MMPVRIRSSCSIHGSTYLGNLLAVKMVSPRNNRNPSKCLQQKSSQQQFRLSADPSTLFSLLLLLHVIVIRLSAKKIWSYAIQQMVILLQFCLEDDEPTTASQNPTQRNRQDCFLRRKLFSSGWELFLQTRKEKINIEGEEEEEEEEEAIRPYVEGFVVEREDGEESGSKRPVRSIVS